MLELGKNWSSNLVKSKKINTFSTASYSKVDQISKKSVNTYLLHIFSRDLWWQERRT